jgi:hypothetical protein
VATLADKLGGLVGTLHLFKHRGVRPFLGLHCARSVVFRTGGPLKALSDRTCGGLYGRSRPKSIIAHRFGFRRRKASTPRLYSPAGCIFFRSVEFSTLFLRWKVRRDLFFDFILARPGNAPRPERSWIIFHSRNH